MRCPHNWIKPKQNMFFLTDFIALLRSTGDLTLALDQNSLTQWFERIDHFYQEQSAYEY